MSKRKQSHVFQPFENRKRTLMSSEDSAESTESAHLSAAGASIKTEASSRLHAHDPPAVQSDEPREELAGAAAPIGDCPPSPGDSDASWQQQIPTVGATSASQDDDIGGVKADELKRAPDSVKLKALQSRFQPPRGWRAPSKEICGKRRKIPEDFFDESLYPTLRYSQSVDGVFCVACMVFSSGDTVLRTKALSDWSNARKIVSRHLATPAHGTAQLRTAEFLNAALGKSRSAYSRSDRSYQQAAERDTYGLKAVVDLIAVCARQGIPMRGRTEERGGNFQALLTYRAEGDELLKRYVENAPANAEYRSRRTQDELIELCGKQIRGAILRRCRDAKWFSLLADETGNAEQVALVVRYVHSSGGSYSVREDFLGFLSTADATGDTLTHLLLNRLSELGLDPAHLVGQGYDGAGDAGGKVRGAQARIRVRYPAAVYVHCRHHALNLAVARSTRIPVVRNALNTAREVASFIAASPARLLSNSSDKERLRKFSDTQHDMGLSALVESYADVLATLVELKTDGDAECSCAASSLAGAMESFEFIVCLVVARELLRYLTPLSGGLRNPDCELPVAAQMARDVVAVLGERKRDDSTYRGMWETACCLAASVGVSPAVPRVAQSRGPSTPAASPEEYWRSNVFLPFVDHVATEVRDRVCLALPRLKAQYLLPDKLPLLTDGLWRDIKEEYGDLMPGVDAADVELELWRQRNGRAPAVGDVCQVLGLTADFYPNIHAVVKVLLTMPVCGAGAERCFSCLPRLRAYLSDTAPGERLSGLALMSVHHDVGVDAEAVLLARSRAE
ncbi:52 kDa repressor of the inhibitor of the protein kinase-like [Lampris incognitus]|uniref:52 kDa repressor of the inhibitor of the protein kinase-like n=1 Tax=Lampris incognitus TaxID=2546036 RepID=UPI0024B5A741|nr:52 kDa repressor of the inhibitor of the protein kinase-like [Lampris incognitus]